MVLGVMIASYPRRPGGPSQIRRKPLKPKPLEEFKPLEPKSLELRPMGALGQWGPNSLVLDLT